MTRRLVHGGLAVLLAITAVGCGDSSSAAKDAALVSMLSMVPDTPQSRKQVAYGNLERLRGEEPAQTLDADLRALGEASNREFFVAGPAGYSPDLVEEAGFDLTNLDASVEVGEAPPRALWIYIGRLDPERVDHALTETAPFTNEIDTGEVEDTMAYAVGEAGQWDGWNQDHWRLRPFGGPLRIGVDDSTMWLANTNPDLRRAIRASAGNTPSLAEDDTYVDVAEVVDDADAFNAWLFGAQEYTGKAWKLAADQNASPLMVAELQEQIDAGTVGLSPWLVGAMADVEGELLVVLAHEDEAAAERNAERLRTVVEKGTSLASQRPWSKLLGDADDIEVDGHLLIARFPTSNPLAQQLVADREGLVVVPTD